MSRAVVAGGGGFIGHHLGKKLKKEGKWVRGVDVKYPDADWKECFDEFLILDLTNPDYCKKAVAGMEEVYQLAANMGGMGFIHSAETEIMHDNVLINLNMIQAAVEEGVKKYFFSSSVCMYRNMKVGEKELTEEEAYPAMPDNEYGWEKLYSERLILTYGRHYPIKIRIARFQNTYGPEGTYSGGREKAPAALCRKAILADKSIEVWGDGNAVRSYTYIDDLVEGIILIMNFDLQEPINIGNPQYHTVDELAREAIKISGKNLKIEHVKGPVGVESRNFSNKKIYSLGWSAKWPLEKGLVETYDWIESEINKSKTNT